MIKSPESQSSGKVVNRGLIEYKEYTFGIALKLNSTQKSQRSGKTL